jgi:hypothetical protein
MRTADVETEDLELLLDGKLACGFIMHEEEATWVA